ncbi:15-hydroxyprostaglandin dehydrogenase [NAD(+)]-like [Ptiloglossa arizonensis]|uniref:15-hydroxyprostaglandin dehydrogenase [NAD(+)]-like n=1 Tax=Ptiloglossa arizonensis TaxID=3350558 RepID=UPI003FA14CCF
MDCIKNKTALVTGSAGGLGYSYVENLLQNGAKVVAILDLPTSAGATSAAILEKKYGKGKAIFFPCDVTNTQQFEETFGKVVKAFTVIDIVINNAGALNDKKWEQIVRLNVGGVIQGSLLAIEHMNKQTGGKGGILVNIASIVCLSSNTKWPVYCSTKHQVLEFTRCLQDSADELGMKILVMCPGVTSTMFLDDFHSKALNFFSEDTVKKSVENLTEQPPEHVGKAMVSLIQHGKNGAIWVSENGESPYAVEFPPPKKVELKL